MLAEALCDRALAVSRAAARRERCRLCSDAGAGGDSEESGRRRQRSSSSASAQCSARVRQSYIFVLDGRSTGFDPDSISSASEAADEPRWRVPRLPVAFRLLVACALRRSLRQSSWSMLSCRSHGMLQPHGIFNGTCSEVVRRRVYRVPLSIARVFSVAIAVSCDAK